MEAATRYVFKNMMNDYQFSLFEKTIAVLDSCKRVGHVAVAAKYAGFAAKKADFPWDITGHLLEKIDEIKESAKEENSHGS